MWGLGVAGPQGPGHLTPEELCSRSQGTACGSLHLWLGCLVTGATWTNLVQEWAGPASCGPPSTSCSAGNPRHSLESPARLAREGHVYVGPALEGVEGVGVGTRSVGQGSGTLGRSHRGCQQGLRGKGSQSAGGGGRGQPSRPGLPQGFAPMSRALRPQVRPIRAEGGSPGGRVQNVGWGCPPP